MTTRLRIRIYVDTWAITIYDNTYEGVLPVMTTNMIPHVDRLQHEHILDFQLSQQGVSEVSEQAHDRA